MRKILLTAVIALTAFNMQAQTWNSPATWSKTLAPVTEADQLAGTKVTIATDGSVITTGTFNQDVTFGNTKLENADQLTSAYIAKYNADGTEAWAVSMFGAAVVNAVDTDAEGNIFVAGNLADAVEFSSVDGNGQTVKGMEEQTAMVTGFLAKYDKGGNLKAVRTIIPTTEEDALASGLYGMLGVDVVFTPQKLQVVNDKLYISAIAKGKVTIDDMVWRGSYALVWDFAYMDIYSAGVMTVNTSDLGGAANIAYLQAKENYASLQCYPESVNFTVAEDGTVYAGFVGKGAEILTTASGTYDITMNTEAKADGETWFEHAFILSKITPATVESKVYHVAPHGLLYSTDIISDMILDGGNLYIGGTFYGELGFDTTKKSVGASDVFVANVNPANFATNWVTAYECNEGDERYNEERMKNMVVYKGNVFVNSVVQEKAGELIKVQNLNYDTTGALRGGDAVNYSDISVPQNDIIATIVNDGVNTTVSVFGATADGIDSIESEASATSNKIYNILGQPVNNLTKGLYIIGGRKVIVN